MKLIQQQGRHSTTSTTAIFELEGRERGRLKDMLALMGCEGHYYGMTRKPFRWSNGVRGVEVYVFKGD